MLLLIIYRFIYRLECEFMRKITGLILVSALVLSACRNGNTSENTVGATVSGVESTETVDAHSANGNTGMIEGSSADPETNADAQTGEEFPEEMLIYYTPLDIGLTAEYAGEWDDKGPIITADCAKILVLEDGFKELKDTIDAYNALNWKEVHAVYTEHLEYAKEDVFPEGTELSISREVELTRADSKVLSFINAETAYLGGAHGSYYEDAVVFDSETGKELKLTDVITDLDAVYQRVKNSLKENYEKETFFEGYEEWLEEMFYEPEGAMSSPLEWVLTMEGLEFRFSPYVLGPWVAGTFEVKLPYAGNEELFVTEYLCTVKHPIRKIAPDEVFYVDTDWDGIEDKVWFTEAWNEETYSSTLKVERECEHEDSSGTSSTLTVDDIHGKFGEAYLMYSKEEIPYLYVEFMMENDWRKLEIVRLAESETFHSFQQVGGVGTAVYGHFISDPNQFALYDRLDILGTYSAYKNYEVGVDGIPVSDDELYNIVIPHFSWNHALTAKREIPVLMHVEGSDEKVEEKLPKGTKFKPRKTDGETMVEMELEDGRRCDILVERPEGEYACYINGISEYDCFEDVPYAG